MEGQAGMEMPRYRSHKTVWALKIKEVDHSGPNPGAVVLVFEDERYAPTEVSIIDKPQPEDGWYYVVYKDGYHSFSPAAQFEEGNTLEPQTFKDRVVAEKMELDDKIRKLTAFVGGEIFASLPDAERSRMSIQLQHMNGYSEILSQRIAAF